MKDTLFPPLLELRDVSVAFGGLRAVDGVSLQVRRGAIVGLIGPNGAGKTTLIDAVTGFVPLTEGSIILNGVDIMNRSAHRRAHAKLARTFQSLELFEDLTVSDNIRVPTETNRWWRSFGEIVFPATARDSASVTWALAQFGLEAVADQLPGSLSQAQRKQLGLARAVVARPQLLLLDEPGAGLDKAGTEALGARIRELVTDGTGLLLVDHDMALVLPVCDYIYVLDTGRLIAAGTPVEVRTNPDVLRSYLGEEPPGLATDVGALQP